MFWRNKKEQYKQIIEAVEKTPCTFHENPLQTDIVTVIFEGHLPKFWFTTNHIYDWPERKPYSKYVHEAIMKRYERYLISGNPNITSDK